MLYYYGLMASSLLLHWCYYSFDVNVVIFISIIVDVLKVGLPVLNKEISEIYIHTYIYFDSNTDWLTLAMKQHLITSQPVHFHANNNKTKQSLCTERYKNWWKSRSRTFWIRCIILNNSFQYQAWYYTQTYGKLDPKPPMIISDVITQSVIRLSLFSNLTFLRWGRSKWSQTMMMTSDSSQSRPALIVWNSNKAWSWMIAYGI